MELKPGSRWKSAMSSAEVVVVRAPKSPVTLECGGQPMSTAGGGTADPAVKADVLLGKRYVDGDSGLEVLCAKAGAGPLTVDGRVLTVKETRALPASD